MNIKEVNKVIKKMVEEYHIKGQMETDVQDLYEEALWFPCFPVSDEDIQEMIDLPQVSKLKPCEFSNVCMYFKEMMDPDDDPIRIRHIEGTHIDDFRIEDDLCFYCKYRCFDVETNKPYFCKDCKKIMCDICYNHIPDEYKEDKNEKYLKRQKAVINCRNNHNMGLLEKQKIKKPFRDDLHFENLLQWVPVYEYHEPQFDYGFQVEYILYNFNKKSKSYGKYCFKILDNHGRVGYFIYPDTKESLFEKIRNNDNPLEEICKEYDIPTYYG